MEDNTPKTPEWAKYIYYDWMEDPIFGTIGLRMVTFASGPLVLVENQWVVPEDMREVTQIKIAHDKGISWFAPFFVEVHRDRRFS